MLKDLLHGIRVQCRGYLERPASEESPIGAEDVAMGVEVEEIAEGLDGDDCTYHCIPLKENHREECLQ